MMMLPKGIVINTTSIYDEVANYSIVPSDRVWEFWHVYTTTNKKLRDPTACRLENFWWHVWGSDRRLLSGRTLARLYEHISDGPTIAPLQGPPNRWEGPDAPLVTRQVIVAHLTTERQGGQPSRRPPPPMTRPSDTSVKSLPSPSASRPPAPHPILKKTRGPSSSGPRPTARVISPHDSPDEAVEKDGDLASSSSTVVTVVESSAAPAAPPKKKPTVTGKKFVVASSTARRRPLISRRSSSQATAPVVSVEPAESSRDGFLTTGSRQRTRPVSPIPERTPTTPRDREEYVDEADQKTPPVPSAKALGKRPALASSTAAASGRGKPGARSLSSTSLQGRSGAARQRTSMPRARSFVDDATPPKVSRTVSDSVPSSAEVVKRPATLDRSQSSHGDYGRGSDARSISQGLFTGATASTTNVAAQGTIIDQAGSLPTSSIMGGPFGDGSPRTPSLLNSRLTPTQPAPSPHLPMARTRSQLTLLLEREKERTADRTRSKG